MGRRRRNAYWASAGGGSEQIDPNEPLNLVKVAPSQEVPPVEMELPVVNTRRSLRQQAKKAAQQSYAEDDTVDNSDEEEELAQFTPLTTMAPRKKRFLKESRVSKFGKRKADLSENTSTVLNRLIHKRKPGYVVRHGRLNAPKTKIAGTNVLRGILPKHSHQNPTASTAVHQPQKLNLPALPVKVEIQEALLPPPAGPKKRGRKRKVDIQGQSGPLVTQSPVVKSESTIAPDPDWDPNVSQLPQQQRKRGRQSAATANVKNRFPFCSICLSKAPPNDYIINYMSCPSEYQRMKRLFTYIYKDLKFPFMPFDLERENVFDYCDLPLCDCCIQLYREIYDSYSQIEIAREQLKTKIERMVYQIQLSEQNPAVAQQLSSIKNSPDALMNKYCNFRRRFATYRPGDSRGEVQATSLVPATIARIQIIKETHKRTTGSQTFLTAGHFPPPVPPTPAAAQDPVPSTSTTPATSSTTKTSNASVANVSSVSTPVVVKKEVDSEPANASQSASKPQTSKPNNGILPTAASKDSKDSLPQNQSTHKKTTPQSTSQATSSAPQTKAIPTTIPAKPAPHSSVLTIVKSPGGSGAAIIRKLPVKPANSIIGLPAKLLAIATPTHKSQFKPKVGTITNSNTTLKTSASAIGQSSSASGKHVPAKQNATPSATIAIAVKDEPVDAEEGMNANEADPFFNSDPPTAEKKASDDEKTQSKLNTNVFHKHKKLKVLPVPSYKDSSNDSSSDANVMKDKDDDKGDDDSDNSAEKADTEDTKEKDKNSVPGTTDNEKVDAEDLSKETSALSSNKDKN